jgi:hypothetical protein
MAFNSLLRSYSDNYIQFKVTGNSRYRDAYTSAQQGLDKIISDLQDSVNGQKQQIAAFYKSGVEQKLSNLQQQNKFLQRGILSEQDEITASKMRSDASAPSLPSVPTWQYIAIGSLLLMSIGLSVM